MRNLLLLIFLFLITSCTREENTQIHISGTFPAAKNAHVKMLIKENGKKIWLRTQVKDGKFHIAIDSLEKGIYNVIINLERPFEKRYITYQNEQGKTIRKYLPKVVKYINFTKKLYINPDQSRKYHIIPEKDITDEIMNDYDSISYLRTDLFRLKVISEAEDTRLFEKLDSVKEYFKYTRYLIYDSLYRFKNKPNKADFYFRNLSLELNFEKNYQTLLKSRREIIKNNLDNPIAAWDLLDIGNDQFSAEVNEYERLLKQFTGRAKESLYYKLAMLKLNSLKSPLTEGQVLLLPTGKTPDLKDLNFSPSDYRYTLVEFWASWCAPCRAQNPNWNELLADYKDNGFKILGVSLDISAENWTKAIAEDHLDDWLHASDIGDGFKGANALRYGIQVIPFNILIDRRGRILKKNITPAKLREFLNSNPNQTF